MCMCWLAHTAKTNRAVVAHQEKTQMTNATHTPTPWRISQVYTGEEKSYPKNSLRIAGPKTASVQCVYKRENAEFIVRAVNAHDALVSSCEFALAILEQAEQHEQADGEVGRASTTCIHIRHALDLARR